MSVSKPFLFALVCDRLGPRAVRAKIGMNATGLGFNSLAGIERHAEGLTNPMVNAGAIASTSLAPGSTLEERWSFILEGLSRFAGRELRVNQEVYDSASETNFRNRSIVWLLHSFGRVYCEPLEALELYTRQCSLDVSAHDLAVMGPPWRTAASTRSAAIRSLAPKRVTTLWPPCLRPACTRPPATGFTRSVCRARAASVAASSPCRQARAGSVPSRLPSITLATASRANSLPVTCRRGSASTSFSPNQFVDSLHGP